MESPKKKIIKCWGPLEVKERAGGGDLQGGLGGAGEQGLGLQGGLGGGQRYAGTDILLKIRTCFRYL